MKAAASTEAYECYSDDNGSMNNFMLETDRGEQMFEKAFRQNEASEMESMKAIL